MNKLDDPYKERDEQTKKELYASGLKFIRPLTTHSSGKEACKLVQEHAGQDWDRVYAGELEAARRDRELADEQTALLREKLRALEKQRQATKTDLTISAAIGIGDKQANTFAHWILKDQLTFCCSLFFMVLVLCAGAGNVYSAIMVEAIPVFLDHPYLAWLLACLLPAGSVALHSFNDLLSSDRSRDRYARLISMITFVLLVVWAVCFAASFQIGDDMTDPEWLNRPATHTPQAFTAVQILTELFIGASLALNAGHIHSRYSKDKTIPNPEAEILDKRIGDMRVQCESPQDRRWAYGRHMQLQAMRGVHIGEQTALFRAIRNRLDETNPI